MTAVLSSNVSTRTMNNPFDASLRSGFHLGDAQVVQIAQLMREVPVPPRHQSLQIPPKRVIPKVDDPDERDLMRREVDASNARRLAEIVKYFSYLGDEAARLLASKVRSRITGFSTVRCPYDTYYTLICEQ